MISLAKFLVVSLALFLAPDAFGNYCEGLYSSLVTLNESGRPARLVETNFYQDFHFPNSNSTYSAYKFKIHLPTGHWEHEIGVIVPNYQDQNAIEQIKNGVVQSLMELPQQNIEATSLVRVNGTASSMDSIWQVEHAKVGFTNAAASAGGGLIDLYPTTIGNFYQVTAEGMRVMRHEHGHNIAHKFWGSTKPPADWIAAARSDTYSVSHYGNQNWDEDFAEAIEFYLRAKAGTLDPNLRKSLIHRFQYLDRLFGLAPKPQVGINSQQAVELANLVNQLSPDQLQQTAELLNALVALARGNTARPTPAKISKVDGKILMLLPGAGLGFLLAEPDSLKVKNPSKPPGTL